MGIPYRLSQNRLSQIIQKKFNNEIFGNSQFCVTFKFKNCLARPPELGFLTNSPYALKVLMWL